MVEKPSANPDKGPSEDRPPGRNWAVAGLISGILAFVLTPFLFGLLGILFGFIGYAKGAKRLGRIAVVVSVFSLILGSILYILLQNLLNV